MCKILEIQNLIKSFYEWTTIVFGRLKNISNTPYAPLIRIEKQIFNRNIVASLFVVVGTAKEMQLLFLPSSY